MSSFIKTTSCQKIEQKCVSGNLYAPKEDEGIIISKLSAKINQLEQQERDFNLLNDEFKQLENDFTLLNEAKLRLEYEIKQRDEAYNKRICDLKNGNENLQNALNDKVCVNKKLYEEKQCLENHLSNKKDEVNDLKGKIEDLDNKLNDAKNNNDGLNGNLKDLNDIKIKQRDKITNLVDDNKKLAKLCQEQDHSLYMADKEKQKLSQKIQEDQANINNLNSKIRAHANNLDNLHKDLDCSNEINIKLQSDQKTLESELHNDKIDNENLNDEYCREKCAREDEDKQNEELKCILCDRQNKLNMICNDYEKIKIAHQRMTEERNVYQNENDKLKEHVMILTTENQELNADIDNVIQEDEHVMDVLNRTDRLSYALKDNDSILSQLPEEILCATNIDNKLCCVLNDDKSFMNQPERTVDGTFTKTCTYVIEQK